MDAEIAKSIREQGDAALDENPVVGRTHQEYLNHLKQHRPDQYKELEEAGLLKHAAAIAVQKKLEAEEAYFKQGLDYQQGKWLAMRDHIYPETEQEEQEQAEAVQKA